MRKAGGIIGIIAGIFGVFAALVTLSVGGIGGAFKADGASLVVGLGLGGLLFSFGAIVFGALCLGAKSSWPGLLLTLNALAGAVLGGTLVAFCMALALVGGVLALLRSTPTTVASPTHREPPDANNWADNADQMIARYKCEGAASPATASPQTSGGFGRRNSLR
jgi:hypothetical protein